MSGVAAESGGGAKTAPAAKPPPSGEPRPKMTMFLLLSATSFLHPTHPPPLHVDPHAKLNDRHAIQWGLIDLGQRQARRQSPQPTTDRRDGRLLYHVFPTLAHNGRPR